jgi:hypothetical protein
MTQKDVDIQLCLEHDLNPRSQCSSGPRSFAVRRAASGAGIVNSNIFLLKVNWLPGQSGRDMGKKWKLPQTEIHGW